MAFMRLVALSLVSLVVGSTTGADEPAPTPEPTLSHSVLNATLGEAEQAKAVAAEQVKAARLRGSTAAWGTPAPTPEAELDAATAKDEHTPAPTAPATWLSTSECPDMDPERLKDLVEAARSASDRDGIEFGDVLPGAKDCTGLALNVSRLAQSDQYSFRVYLSKVTTPLSTNFLLEFGGWGADQWFPECWKSFAWNHFGWTGGVGAILHEGACIIRRDLMDLFMETKTVEISFLGNIVGGSVVTFSKSPASRQFQCVLYGASTASGGYVSATREHGFGGPVTRWCIR